MATRTIRDIDVSGKKVLMRVDFNVPLAGGKVSDEKRIVAALPSIRTVVEGGGKLVLMSHLGRPKGKRNPKFSMRPVGERLAQLLEDVDVILPEDCIGDGVRKLASELEPGKVMLLENLRFHPQEEANEESFAKQLAALAEVYINDAFGAAHRAHASTTGMVPFVPSRGAGFLMRSEITVLSRLLESPEQPFVALLGGAKVSDKIGVIENLMNLCDTLLIGGGMSFTFLAAQGIPVGNSLVEKDKLHTAKRILERADTRGIPILLPSDHVVASQMEASAATQNTNGPQVPEGMMGLDIGRQTISKFSEVLARARTIFWNGPMGVFELPAFAGGTNRIAMAVAKSQAYSVVGGGDSVAALKKAGLDSYINHISTGGGASLEFIEGKRLPGIAALEE